jgi:hypothetical protein
MPYREMRLSPPMPKGGSHSDTLVRRRHLMLSKLYALALLLAGVSYWVNIVRVFPHEADSDLIWILKSVLGNGAFNVVAWGMIAVRARGIAPTGQASRQQIAFTVAIALMCVVPTKPATVGVLLALAVALALPSLMRCGRCIAVLLLGLAIELIWQSSYFSSLHLAAATLDARAVKALLGVVGQIAWAHGNVVENGTTQTGIEVLGFCASSFPFAQVALAYLVTKVYFGRLPTLADLPWFAASLLASIALTELRLSLMTVSETSYNWWHTGNGVTVYTFALTAASVLFPFMATHKSQHAKPRVVGSDITTMSVS